MAKELKKFIQCDCGSEYVYLEPQDPDFPEEGLYMSILAHAYDKPSFWHRFRHIWYTLIHGKPYTDQVCLDLEKCKELYTFLFNYVNSKEVYNSIKKHTKKKSNTILIYPNKEK